MRRRGGLRVGRLNSILPIYIQLGCVGVGTLVRHAEDPASFMRQAALELILKRLPLHARTCINTYAMIVHRALAHTTYPCRLASTPCTRRITSLDLSNTVGTRLICLLFVVTFPKQPCLLTHSYKIIIKTGFARIEARIL